MRVCEHEIKESTPRKPSSTRFCYRPPLRLLATSENADDERSHHPSSHVHIHKTNLNFSHLHVSVATTLLWFDSHKKIEF